MYILILLLSLYMYHTDPGSNNSGYYDLLAVLTHQGRSSSSGHYVAWIRKGNGEWALIRSIYDTHSSNNHFLLIFLLRRSVV